MTQKFITVFAPYASTLRNQIKIRVYILYLPANIGIHYLDSNGWISLDNGLGHAGNLLL